VSGHQAAGFGAHIVHIAQQLAEGGKGFATYCAFSSLVLAPRTPLMSKEKPFLPWLASVLCNYVPARKPLRILLLSFAQWRALAARHTAL
jgi:hypothetical protein